MDVRIRERLVGALVLVALVVLVVPAVLKGPTRPVAAPATAETRSVEIPLEGAAPAQSDALVPEPEIADAQPDSAPSVAPAAAEPAQADLPAKDGPKAPAAAVEQARAAPAQQPAWAVQLGAFSSRSKADGLVAKLRSRGYSAFVLEYRAGGQLLHRVRVGPEQDRARAVEIAERLRKDGYQAVVAPHP